VISVLRTALGRGHARNVTTGAALVVATLAIAVGPALAASPTVFRNIATTVPGNVASVGYEATSTSEFGDLVQLAAGGRASANLPVTVVMSSWGCQRGGNATCSTDPGATWSQPLTLTIYNADLAGAVPAVGTVVLQTTQTFAIPYRPSYDPAGPCAAKNSTGWYSTLEAKCYNGYSHPVTFALPAGITLPGELIWSIAYNTSHHGYAPLGDDPTNALNNPWDSLNVGAVTYSGEPSVGSDVEPTSAFLNSSGAQFYNDNGAAGTGTFRDDVGGWTDYAPLACFGYCPINLAAAPTPTPAPPTATPTLAPTLAPTSGASGSADPSEQVAGVTATPVRATLPPTSSSSPSDGGSSGLLLLLISLGFGSLGLFAVGAQRRAVRQ
jgi:hypothetical protein